MTVTTDPGLYMQDAGVCKFRSTESPTLNPGGSMGATGVEVTGSQESPVDHLSNQLCTMADVRDLTRWFGHAENCGSHSNSHKSVVNSAVPSGNTSRISMNGIASVNLDWEMCLPASEMHLVAARRIF